MLYVFVTPSLSVARDDDLPQVKAAAPDLTFSRDLGQIVFPSSVGHQFDIGTIDLGRPVVLKLKLKNESKETINVKGVDVSCGCTNGAVSKSSCLTGESIDFLFTISKGVKVEAFGIEAIVKLDSGSASVLLNGRFGSPLHIPQFENVFRLAKNDYEADLLISKSDSLKAEVEVDALTVSDGFEILSRHVEGEAYRLRLKARDDLALPNGPVEAEGYVEGKYKNADGLLLPLSLKFIAGFEGRIQTKPSKLYLSKRSGEVSGRILVRAFSSEPVEFKGVFREGAPEVCECIIAEKIEFKGSTLWKFRMEDGTIADSDQCYARFQYGKHVTSVPIVQTKGE